MGAMTIAAAAYLAKAGYDIYSGWKGKKESTSRLGELSKSYRQKSPLETEWLAMLRKRMTEGALPTREMMQRVSSQVGETGQVARQRAQGYAASRGLEHSGVAASMVGQVDAQKLRSIADQARAIAIQNEMTKTGAQQEFGQYAQGESGLIRQLATMKYGAEQDISDTAQQRISEGIGGVGQAAGIYAQGDPSEMIMNFLGSAEDQEGFDYRLSLLRMLYPDLFKSGGGAKEMPINPHGSME